MDYQEFDAVLEDTLNKCRKVMGSKASEYADDAERLHNFKQAAHLAQITPIQALGGFMIKHTVSIYDMIYSGESYSQELWDEKIGDHLNYLILLRALAIEEALDEQLELEFPDKTPSFAPLSEEKNTETIKHKA